MATPVTVYRWDDVGAPQVVDGRPSEYLNVLKKCLIEGYGTKVGLGWSLLDEETAAPYCAFINDNSIGSGGAAMFSASNDNVGQKVTVRGAQDYIDRVNYSRSTPYHAFDYASAGGGMNKYWILIGTGKAFYFFCYSDYSMETNKTTTRHVISFFIGDMNSLIPNDPATFICIAGVQNNSNTSWSYSLPYKFGEVNLVNISSIHPLDGTDNATQFSITSLFSVYGYVNGNHTSAPNILVLSPSYIALGSGSIISSSQYQNETQPFIRGLVPGLFIASDAGYKDDVPPVIKELNGANHYLIPTCNSNTGCAWINLESW